MATFIPRAAKARNILVSFTAVAAATTMAGLGSFADFTDTETGSTPIDSGVVAMSIGANGTANRLSVAATDIVPGDSIHRVANLTVDNSTTSSLSAITLSTSGSANNALTSDGTDGLQMVIKSCSQAWTESGSSPSFSYVCEGSEATVLSSRAIIGTDLSLSNVGLAAGTTNYLLVSVSLPSSAGNSFQNLANTVTYSFTGQQRAAGNR